MVILRGEELCKRVRKSEKSDIPSLQKTEDLITSLGSHGFYFSVCTAFGRKKRLGVEITASLRCCFLRTVYRILVINNLSQDSYFWSGLLGGNLLEVNSFILRLTVLPFPAERGEK